MTAPKSTTKPAEQKPADTLPPAEQTTPPAPTETSEICIECYHGVWPDNTVRASCEHSDRWSRSQGEADRAAEATAKRAAAEKAAAAESRS